MAVINQKSLHKHAVPVIILGSGLLLLSGLIVARVNSPYVSNHSFTQLLNVRLFSIKPSSNGFFHITRFKDAQANLSSLGSNNAGSLSVIDDAGRIAQLNAVVNGAN